MSSENRVNVQEAEQAGGRWPSESEVADQLPIDVPQQEAERIRDSVPLWFHTFSLNRDAGVYTPGVARDHGYRLASIPESFAGLRVIDVGSFDGFYAFLAEHRGAERVLAIDNEQYKEWVRSRWGIELEGGEGFRAIADAIGSRVEYRRIDAYELAQESEQFDVVLCFGILHRVQNPLGLLEVLRELTAPNGRLLLETYGTLNDHGADEGAMVVATPNSVYEDDDFVYWGFSSGSIENLAIYAGFADTVIDRTPVVKGHPRIIGSLYAQEGASFGHSIGIPARYEPAGIEHART